MSTGSVPSLTFPAVGAEALQRLLLTSSRSAATSIAASPRNLWNSPSAPLTTAHSTQSSPSSPTLSAFHSPSHSLSALTTATSNPCPTKPYSFSCCSSPSCLPPPPTPTRQHIQKLNILQHNCDGITNKIQYISSNNITYLHIATIHETTLKNIHNTTNAYRDGNNERR